MQQASQNNYVQVQNYFKILGQEVFGNNSKQRYYMLINCLDKIARAANLDEISKIQKLSKYEKLKSTFGTSNLNIQVPLDLTQIENKSYYIEHKYDCDVEQLIKIDAFNIDAFPNFIYGMFSAINQLHQVGIYHGNIDTFSIGYYSKRGQYLQQFVLMDFNLIDKDRLRNLKNEESIFQDYHDLAQVFLNILLKQEFNGRINYNDQLQKLKYSNQINKYYELIQRMLAFKKLDPQWLLDQFNDNLKPQLIINQIKFQQYQSSQVQLRNTSFNINAYRHTNPANLPQLNQQFNNQINRLSLPNDLKTQQLTNNLINNKIQIQQLHVPQLRTQQLQLMNSPQIGRPQISQTNQQLGQQIVPRQIQTIGGPQIQLNQPMPQQPILRQVNGLSGVRPLIQQGQ